MALWYGLFILGTVPSGISNVYKQHVLQGADVDVPAGRLRALFVSSYSQRQCIKGTSMALWYGLFILGTVPSGISNVYKQHVLQGADVDVTAGRLRAPFVSSYSQRQCIKGTSMALWYGLFILGTVPSGISNVYKQHVLQGADVDVTADRLRAPFASSHS